MTVRINILFQINAGMWLKKKPKKPFTEKLNVKINNDGSELKPIELNKNPWAHVDKKKLMYKYK